ncbi:MAG: hypothetical protein HUJ74_02795 [Lachnospiraceae bacterium]|nr:hypothetical protein [Lachnospiraceae bacterium]
MYCKFNQKIAGIIETEKIGVVIFKIFRSFGIHVIVYDFYETSFLKDFNHLCFALDELFSKSDLLSFFTSHF